MGHPVVLGLGLHAVLGWGVGVEDAVGGVALGPDEQEDVFAVGGGVDVIYELGGRGDGMAVDLLDDVSGSEACVFCGAGGAYALDDDSVDVGGQVELLADVGAEVVYGEAEFAALG